MERLINESASSTTVSELCAEYRANNQITKDEYELYHVKRGLRNRDGTGVMAGYSAAVKLNNLVITSFTTLANGVSNYTAQNIGAGKLQRVRSGFQAGIRMVWSLCVPLVLLYFFAGRYLVGFFIDTPTETAITTGVQYLRILSPFYFVVSSKLVADGILRGSSLMGRFMASTFTDLVLRVVLAYALSAAMGSALGIWCAWPIGWSVATVMSILFYLRGPWQQPQEVLNEPLPDV